MLGSVSSLFGPDRARTPSGRLHLECLEDRTTPAVVVPGQDGMYLVDAAQSAQADVQIGSLAATRASNPVVKWFGNLLVRDHIGDLGQINRVGQVPNSLSPADQATFNLLRNLRGPVFDKIFVNWAVNGHQGDIFDNLTETAEGTSPAAKFYAQTHLPTLQVELNIAQRLQFNLGYSYGDVTYLVQALSVLQLDIDLAELAAARAANNEVRAFAQNLFNTQMQALRDLTPVLALNGIPIPSTLSADSQGAFNFLAGQFGTNFDRVFLAMEQNVLRTTQLLGQPEVTTGLNSAAISFAQAQLLPLQDRTDEVQRLMGLL